MASQFHNYTYRLALCLYNLYHVKALVGAFNQEMALVGAFSMIMNLGLSFQALVTVDVPEAGADVVVASLAQLVQTPAYDDSHRHQLAAAEDVLDLQSRGLLF